MKGIILNYAIVEWWLMGALVGAIIVWTLIDWKGKDGEK